MSRLVLLLAVLPSAAHARGGGEPSPRKQCAVCHVAWSLGFSDRDDSLAPWPGGADLVEGTVGGASTEDICYSCHDGYVQDSRKGGFTGRGHPTGIRPLAGMDVPASMPRTRTGEIYCGTCHTVHSQAASERIDFSLFLRTRNDRSELCLACHPAEGGKEPGVAGHPVHVPVPAGLPPALAAAGARLAKGSNEIVCESCHRTHGTDHPQALRLAPDRQALCAGCHPGKGGSARDEGLLAHRFGARSPRGSIPAEVLDRGGRLDRRGGLTCLTCHKAHRPGTADHLLVQDNEGSAFCVTCHPETRRVVGSAHDLTAVAPRLRDRRGRQASEAGPCGACHGAHGWAQKPGQGRAPVAVCTGCHGPNGQAKKRLREAYSHSVDRPLEGSAQAAGLPLYDGDAHVVKDGKIACGSCHDPHGAFDPDGAGGRTSDLLRKPEGRLCLGCHTDHAGLVGSAHDLSRTAPGLANSKGETAAESGVCGACHLVHGGDPPFGFARAYSLAAPGDAVAGGCLSCPSEGRGETPPVGGPNDHRFGPGLQVAETAGLPRYGPEGSPVAEGGFATCTTCHEPHGLRTTGRFLRKRGGPDSEICLGCHPAQAGLAGSPHDLTTLGRPVQNMHARTPEQAGPCSACHVPHGGGKLQWAAPVPSPGGDPAEGACVACHREEGPASVPGRLRHPEWPAVTTAALWEERPSEPAPFLSGPGGDPAPHGRITCRTCHRTHAPEEGGDGPRPHAEVRWGTALSGFLRGSDVLAPLCGSCHGGEALRLYLRFHDEDTKPVRLGVGW